MRFENAQNQEYDAAVFSAIKAYSSTQGMHGKIMVHTLRLKCTFEATPAGLKRKVKSFQEIKFRAASMPHMYAEDVYESTSGRAGERSFCCGIGSWWGHSSSHHPIVSTFGAGL